LAIACVFAALFAGLARPLGRLYGSNQLEQMMYLCAPVFLFTAARTPAEAILRSEFRFRLFAFRNTVTNLVGAAVAIALAEKGFGPLALAAQSLVQSFMLAIWVWTAVEWRPRFIGRIAWSRSLVRDGASVMAGYVLPLIVPRSVDFAVGFLLGPTPLGLMRVAFRVNDFVSQMVIMPLVGVANAQLSSVSGELAALRRSYMRLMQASAALMCPALIGIGLVAPELVPILFGPKWRAAAPIIQIVSLLAFVAPLNYYFSAAMVALGHSRFVLRQGLLQLGLGILVAALAAQISLEAVMIAHVVRGILLGVYNLAVLRDRMKLTLKEFWRYMAQPYLSTIAMTAVVVLTRAGLGHGVKPLFTLIVLVSAGALTYGAMFWFGGRLRLWPTDTSMLVAPLLRAWRKPVGGG
jgi:O-antigen/teichoic acid export membrane protein